MSRARADDVVTVSLARPHPFHLEARLDGFDARRRKPDAGE